MQKCRERLQEIKVREEFEIEQRLNRAYAEAEGRAEGETKKAVEVGISPY